MNTGGNKPLQPFIILFSTTCLLIVLSVFDGYFIHYHKDLKHLNLFSGLIKTNNKPIEKLRIPPVTKVTKDTSKFNVVQRVVDSLSISDYASASSNGMTHFFEALKNIKTNK